MPKCNLLGWVKPLLPLLLIWHFAMRRMDQPVTGELTGAKFDDVGRADEVEVFVVTSMLGVLLVRSVLMDIRRAGPCKD